MSLGDFLDTAGRVGVAMRGARAAQRGERRDELALEALERQEFERQQEAERMGRTPPPIMPDFGTFGDAGPQPVLDAVPQPAGLQDYAYLTPGQSATMPGPISGFGGGTFDLDGRQVTFPDRPVRPVSRPATQAEIDEANRIRQRAGLPPMQGTAGAPLIPSSARDRMLQAAGVTPPEREQVIPSSARDRISQAASGQASARPQQGVSPTGVTIEDALAGSTGAAATPQVQSFQQAMSLMPQEDPYRRIVGLEGGIDRRTGKFKRSPAGAWGPAQLMPGTAPEAMELAGFDRTDTRWKTDPAVNVAAGRAYYNHMLRQFGGDPVLAAAAYNAGPGNVRKALKKAQTSGMSWVSHVPAETQKYVQNFVSGGGGASNYGGGDPAQVAGAPSMSPAGLQQASVLAQKPLNLTNVNTYLANPERVPPALAQISQERAALVQQARIYATTGNVAAYDAVTARIKEADSNMTRMMGVQSVIDIETFNDPRRASRLVSYLSNGQITLVPRQDGNFAFMAKGRDGQMVAVPGRDNVSRGDAISLLRTASDDAYRQAQEAARAAEATANRKFQQDVELETLKQRGQAQIEQFKGEVGLATAQIKAESDIATANIGRPGIQSLGDGSFVQYDGRGGGAVYTPVEGEGPDGQPLTGYDSVPLSQLSGV